MTIGRLSAPDDGVADRLGRALGDRRAQRGRASSCRRCSAIIARVVEIVPTPTFGEALLDHRRAFLIGNAIAIVVGIPLGVLMGRSVIADGSCCPGSTCSSPRRSSALVPVIMVLFGLGETTIILTVVLFAIWIIVLDTRAGVRSISPSLVEMARSFGASRWQAFTQDLHLGGAAGDPGRHPARRHPRRQGRGHRPAAGVDRRLRRACSSSIPSRFLMEHFWALLIVLFAFAFALNEALAWLERRVDYYAAARTLNRSSKETSMPSTANS